jgi:hypothetical protein
MTPFLFDLPILPESFRFPADYAQLVKDGTLPDIEPWSFISRHLPLSLYYYGGMLIKFPARPLVPFAIINDQSGFYNDG